MLERMLLDLAGLLLWFNPKRSGMPKKQTHQVLLLAGIHGIALNETTEKSQSRFHGAQSLYNSQD